MEMDRSSHTSDVIMEKDNTAVIASNINGSPGVHSEQERQIAANIKQEKANDQAPPIINCPADLNGKRGPQPVIEVAELSYQEYSIKIFTDDAKKHNSPHRFFFEPIVVLDPKSVVVQSQELFQEKKVVIRFTIQMWTQEIRAKVVGLLRSDNPEIKERDVRIMPYESVRLVGKPGSIHPSVTIMEEATSYRRQNEKLNFFLLCDSPATSKILAENLRSFPEFVLRKWQLELECRGLVLYPSMPDDDPSTIMRPLFKFIVFTLPVGDQDGCTAKDIVAKPLTVTDHDKQIKDLIAQMLAQAKNESTSPDYVKELQDLKAKVQTLTDAKCTTAVPVFSVEMCTNADVLTKGQSLSFAFFEFDTKTEYGNFDLNKGTFTVKKSGIFQFNFNGLVKASDNSRKHQFDFMVDGKRKAVTLVNLTLSKGLQSAAFSALLQLVTGQKVSIVSNVGKIHDNPTDRATRFSCVFFN